VGAGAGTAPTACRRSSSPAPAGRDCGRIRGGLNPCDNELISSAVKAAFQIANSASWPVKVAPDRASAAIRIDVSEVIDDESVLVVPEVVLTYIVRLVVETSNAKALNHWFAPGNVTPAMPLTVLLALIVVLPFSILLQKYWPFTSPSVV
jgi:hypothetical protein